MNICQICKCQFEDSDTYEYRGFLSCEKDFATLQRRVDEKRVFVMEVTEYSTKSQRTGEFVNNHDKYHLGNVMPDGLPRMKVTEPLTLQEYEKGIL